MKRLHVHVAVNDLETSIRFYSQLFSATPSVRQADYAKWSLDDPRVNFAISSRGAAPGVNHLGIEVENRDELEEVHGRLKAADAPTIEEGEKVCCYAQSEKTWSEDPQGVQWETFLTTGESTVYGTDRLIPKQVKQAEPVRSRAARSCCAPETA
jgi:catechol 2,3-dioxygenase-like lactoylglutathione lyase family enzyme